MIVSHADVLLLACHAILTWQTVLSAKGGYTIDSCEKYLIYTCTWSLFQSANYSLKLHFLKARGRRGGGGQEQCRFRLGTVYDLLCTLETSKFNGPTCHVGFVKLYTLKALLKASDKINGVTFSATYIVQPSRKITQFPNIFHALRPVACKVYGDQCTREYCLLKMRV